MRFILEKNSRGGLSRIHVLNIGFLNFFMLRLACCPSAMLRFMNMLTCAQYCYMSILSLLVLGLVEGKWSVEFCTTIARVI